MTLWKWSQTAASNDTADSTVNVRESWAPSIVNNSIRALMAACAKARDDWSGNLVTAGTSTAVTITTNQGLTSLTDGFKVTARITTTFGAAPTLAVDGLTAKSIQSVYGTAIPTGACLAGSVHSFVYDLTGDAWIVHGYFPNTPDLAAIEALAGSSGLARKTAADTWALETALFDAGFSVVIYEGGGVISTGVKLDVEVPYTGTLTAVRMGADQSGSIVVDVWKDTYANFPPTVADTITASAKPTISAATKSQDTTLTGWTTAVTAGDILRFNVDSCSTITRCTLAFRLTRT
jgi:hypothetical protein